MKKIISIILLTLCFSASARTQDTVTIDHKYYSTTFSKSKHYPVEVKYWLTRKLYGCKQKLKRQGKYKPDPMLSDETALSNDYLKSGYDTGHNMPADDNTCTAIGMKECFYYSNMCPQIHSLNAGIWKTLEAYTRNMAKTDDSILVWCGSVSVLHDHIGRVEVPDYCWKVIHIQKLNVTEAYSFRNAVLPKRPLATYKVSLDSIYNLSGFRFK